MAGDIGEIGWVRDEIIVEVILFLLRGVGMVMAVVPVITINGLVDTKGLTG